MTATTQDLSYIKKVFLFTHLTGLGAGLIFPVLVRPLLGAQVFTASFWLVCLAMGYVVGALSFFYVRATLKKQLRVQLQLLQGLSGKMEVSEESVEGLMRAMEEAVGRVRQLVDGTYHTIDELLPKFHSFSDAIRYLADRAREGLAAALLTGKDVAAMEEKQRAVMEQLENLSHRSQEEASISRELSASLEEMAGAMNRTRAKFQETSRIAEQMTASVEKVRRQADEVIKAVGNTTRDLDTIGDSLEKIRWGASSSAEASERVKRDATNGLEVVKSSIDEMERIEEESRRATAAMKRLSAQTGEVAKIIEVIKELVSDTELLAFNAAIIAAKAGEEGKGFSVVAEEIRDLADRTTASAQDIHHIVKKISVDTNEVTGAVEATAKRIATGKKLSLSTGEALHKIVASAVEAADASEQIARLTGEQGARAQGLLEQAGGSLNAVKSITGAMQEQQHDLSRIQEGVAQMKTGSDQMVRGMEEQVRANQEFDRSLNERDTQVRAVNEATRFQMEAAKRVASHFAKSEKRLRSNAEKAEQVIRGISEMERLTGALRALAEDFRR
ncbi:methyl-accepting chemotaxis protein [Geoalkalibacter halelectricus]|uniref:Methyl-accepting chemotaxis protein n=1 Tax=Geoalkalibacter halelectricus TaxID=2847045 RepID=A0ABY5ZP25_9BACT|nr:methyl-accepting chemotaxis protein [Geoalkalibacter halelectricus]MDO3378416.1 methyl-accepting chemotaxis protein [Geoalkalibacter halelectricus]UWZ80264.1 methyl-accepting chemotaxis protein [Geoalkalibacter halelectricus]